MKKLPLSLVLIPAILLTSCLKDEIPVSQPDPGNVLVNAFEMGTDYHMVAYYDFETNTFVKEHLKTDWDLGFETGENGWHIVLNSANAMAAGVAPSPVFTSISDTVGIVWKNDVSSGNLDSTAIGDWQNFGGVYCINRGYSYNGTHLGFRKFEVQSVDPNFYTIHYAELDGSNETTIQVPKNDTAFNFTFFSFETNTTASIEPEKENWDIVFRQYTHIFDGHTPYLVTGVLSNLYNVEVAEVFNKAFEDVEFDAIAEAQFSTNIDVIGYDWKSFTGTDYITNPEQVYIIKTTEGLYYKLRFTDFYNDQGEKGTPKFETQAL